MYDVNVNNLKEQKLAQQLMALYNYCNHKNSSVIVYTNITIFL